MILDGTGGAPFPGDLAIYGDRITALGRFVGDARQEIDLNGLMVAPGFIDVNAGDDGDALNEEGLAAKISQGVTTIVVSHIGPEFLREDLHGWVPSSFTIGGGARRFSCIQDYLTAVEDARPRANLLALMSYLAVRRWGTDASSRSSVDPAGIELMSRCLGKAMSDGAWGLSVDLADERLAAASADEVVLVGQRMVDLGGILAVSLRDEGADVLSAIEEALSMGRRLGAGLIISDHKITGAANAGRSTETLAVLQRASQGMMIGLDASPYVAATGPLDVRRAVDAAKVIISWSEKRPDLVGLDLEEAAQHLGVSDLEAVIAVVGVGRGIYFAQDEADVRRVLAFPDTMIASCGYPFDQKLHPRQWGTFPRVLGHYSRDQALFPLSIAVHKMTELAAKRFGLADRGRLEPGAFADICVFDPASVTDNATFLMPTLPSTGIYMVLCNGQPVWRNGALTGYRSGRVLRRRTI